MTTAAITTASRQWATRPDDERYLSLGDLHAAVSQRKRESWTVSTHPGHLRVRGHDGEITVEFDDSTRTLNQCIPLKASHWGFQQLSQYGQAPASYLRTLPAELAAINLQWSLEHHPVRDNVLVLGQSNGAHTLRALTSASYGRIWDEQVVSAVERVNADGRWEVPAATYSVQNPKRATTLYASDRDVFVFLVDPSHPVEVGTDTLFRGFMTWNSEVYGSVFGLTTFLYRYVCDNRMIWGATDVQELRIRHTRGAPERFAYEGARYLKRYSEETTRPVVAQIEAAQRYEIPHASTAGKVEEWLQARGFTSAVAKNAVAAANMEEGDASSLWNVIQGVTAYARQIPHANDRTMVERQAGKLMELVSGQ